LSCDVSAIASGRRRKLAAKQEAGSGPPLLRIPIRARAEKKKDIAAANGFAVVSAVTFRPMAFTIRPRQAAIRADRYADSANVRLVPGFQSLEIMLRTASNPWKILAVAFRTLDGL
jgi:hypothetical protein